MDERRSTTEGQSAGGVVGKLAVDEAATGEPALKPVGVKAATVGTSVQNGPNSGVVPETTLPVEEVPPALPPTSALSSSSSSTAAHAD